MLDRSSGDSFAGAKAAPEDAGDIRTWVAIDADTKLVPSWRIGDRSGETALSFVDDLASRLANRVQITTDGHRAYLEAIEGAFGATWTTPSFTRSMERSRGRQGAL
jgi:IS1 family transposase